MNKFEERELEELAKTPEMEDKYGPIIDMDGKARIAKARKALEEKWDNEGACNSCGWHGALFEHRVEDGDILDALEHDGILQLGCVNPEMKSRNHRGVNVYIGEQDND